MTSDLLPILRERYPSLLGDPNLCEIGCFPGWLTLLDDLCAKLKIYLDAHSEVPAITVVRIKEKWAELRFIYHGGDEVCREMVRRAVEASLTVCEVCSATGELIGDRWFGVRCAVHISCSPVPTAAETKEGRDDE
ncbi:hypothetical protein RHM65_18460 [Pseudomonas sp. CCI4.2]|uniref:hypothetical protein n=1 Tax=Pseudomonas sp. CCI4.2 TaxID=3048620 RepID=UPI002AC9D99C|nr:hypothetical protein [Pseudomonas sp. CCI4.2]MEB0092945.1 hypothetical protein [Pseudomonas sp. CCI4.2]WPX52786.1 hypothetical protein RHM65_18460 [Pseudomonas sp. CCI4.2]